MADPRLEDLFATFRSTRDSNALAAIFDATASELLLVAVHLVGDRAEAEDLVQITFVELIERADQYDATRPLKPWLVGILANRAKMLLRRRKRAPSHEVGEPEATAAKTNPVDAAEAQEAAQHISRALEELPSQYRHILVLHLVHGLGGVQIAQSLDRPPATIRTQIKRGLEMLRSALPAALSIPAILLVTEGRGLAAVRATVLKTALEKAGEATVVGAGIGTGMTVVATAGGMLAMKKVMFAAVCVVLGLGMYFGLDSVFATSDPIDSGKPQVARSTELETITPATPVAVSDARTSIAPSTAESTEVSTEVVVTGRCVESVSGMPHTAEQIVVRANPDFMKSTVDHGRLNASQSWPVDAAKGTSSPDGRFELRFEYDPKLSFSLEMSGATFVGVSGGLKVEGPGTLDLGDIPVHRGSRLRGRIVDELERPLPGATLLIEFPSPTLGSRPTQTGTMVRSDRDGRFTLHNDERLLPGKITVMATDGYTLVRPAQFELTGDSEFHEQVIVLHKQKADETITGYLIDQEKRRLADVELSVAGRSDRGTIRTYKTAEDGSFSIHRLASDGEQIRIVAEGSLTTVPLRTKPLTWGSKDLELVQQKAARIQIVVRDAATQEPIEDYSVAVRWSDDPIKYRSGRTSRHPETHPGGILSLPGIGSTGKLVVLALPFSSAYEMSDYQRFDLNSLPLAPIVIEVHKKRPVQIDVRDSAGQPIASAKIHLIQLMRDGSLDQDIPILTRNYACMNLNTLANDWPHPFELAEGTTDASGRSTLACIDADRQIGLRIEAKGYTTLLTAPIELPAKGQTYEAVLATEGTIKGTIRFDNQRHRYQRDIADKEVSLGAIRIAVRRPGGEIQSPDGGRNYGYTIRADNSYHIEGLAPGRWELVLYWWRPTDNRSRTGIIIEPELAIVDLDAGQTLDLDLDATKTLPATISGTVIHAGLPSGNRRVFFTRRFLDKNGETKVESSLGGITTDKLGRFEIAGLLPGDYLLQVDVADKKGNPQKARTLHWIHLRRGGSSDQTFDVAVRSIELQLVDPSGTPIRNRLVTVLADEFCKSWTKKTGPDGKLAFFDAGNATYRLLIHKRNIITSKSDSWAKVSARKSENTASYTVPGGAAPHQAKVTVRL